MMKSSLSIAFALAAATLALASSQSSAQFLPPGGPPRPPIGPGPGFPGQFPPPPPPRFYPPPVYVEPQPYYREDVVGDICYTSRGECQLDYSLPVGSGCRCFIPGFGRKRGTVGQ